MTSNTEQPLAEAVSSELGSDNVLRVSSEASWHASLSAWVSEKLDETVIVTGGDERLVLVEVDTIDMGSISSSWEESVNGPSELAVTGLPDGSSGVRCTVLVLSAVWDTEEEELVSVTD